MFAQTQETLKDLNSEIKKESYNLSDEDKSNMKTLNKNVKVLSQQQEEIVKQQKQWIDNTKISLQHHVKLENKDFSKQIADKIVQKVTPNVASTFERETELIKKKSKDMEQSMNNLEKQMKRYKSMAVTGIVAFFVIAILVLLFTSMSNGLFDFLGIEMWYNMIATHMEKARGFMIILWGVAYVLPYFIFAGIVLLLYWAIEKFLL
ncbi:sugar-specific transcriptional regulator TrmB [Staphylococcus hominis]